MLADCNRFTPRKRPSSRHGPQGVASRGVPWIIEGPAFDYCAIDHEHGAFYMETIANLASWFQARTVTAIVGSQVIRASIPGFWIKASWASVSEGKTAEEACANPSPWRISADRKTYVISGHGRHTGYQATATATLRIRALPREQLNAGYRALEGAGISRRLRRRRDRHDRVGHSD